MNHRNCGAVVQNISQSGVNVQASCTAPQPKLRSQDALGKFELRKDFVSQICHIFAPIPGLPDLCFFAVVNDPDDLFVGVTT